MRLQFALATTLALATCTLDARAQSAAPTPALSTEEAALLSLIDSAIRAHPALHGSVRWSFGSGDQEQNDHGHFSIDARAVSLRTGDNAVFFADAEHVAMFDPLPAPGSFLRRAMRTPMTDYAAIVHEETSTSSLFIPRILAHTASSADVELLPRTPWTMVERIVARVNLGNTPGRIERALTFDGLGGHFRIDLLSLAPARHPLAISEPEHAGAHVIEF
jgi:hypothetical protein